jgi:hypothetical protein
MMKILKKMLMIMMKKMRIQMIKRTLKMKVWKGYMMKINQLEILI